MAVGGLHGPHTHRVAAGKLRLIANIVTQVLSQSGWPLECCMSPETKTLAPYLNIPRPLQCQSVTAVRVRHCSMRKTQ